MNSGPPSSLTASIYSCLVIESNNEHQNIIFCIFNQAFNDGKYLFHQIHGCCSFSEMHETNPHRLLSVSHISHVSV